MTKDALKAFLSEVEISQVDFARLVGVTPRAVTLWLNGDREIPGPAAAYVRVFKSLTPNLRQVELSHLKEKGNGMREGMFGIRFQSASSDVGEGMLVFEAGRVYGVDAGGARYDGEYVFDEVSSRTNVVVKVTFPPHVVSVFGISNPYEWAIDVSANFNPKQNAGSVAVKTSLGRELTAQFRYLRALPEAA